MFDALHLSDETVGKGTKDALESPLKGLHFGLAVEQKTAQIQLPCAWEVAVIRHCKSLDSHNNTQRAKQNTEGKRQRVDVWACVFVHVRVSACLCV